MKARANALVLPIGALARGDVAAAGGKGANLGELLRAGLPVPDGFVVTTAAYDRLIAVNNLEILVRKISDQKNGSVIRRTIEEAPIPGDIEGAILAAYRRLGGGSVAVRSSATAEDLPGESFAGQHDSFLNITGDTELVEAVRHCWASLWNDRAIDYRERNGIDQRKVKIAVVVQRMVQAEFAGVLFTVNPITGARNEMVIEAHPGLGEAVGSGMSIPDHFVLRQRLWGWTVTSRRQGRRRDTIVPGTGLQAAATGNIPLTPTGKELKTLARLGAAIERHFGSSQDAEWAVAEGKAYIVQARPMTAVPEPPLHPSRLQKIAAGMLAEFLPERPYPLEITTWTPVPFHALSVMIRPLGLRLPRFPDLFILEDDIVIKYRGKVKLDMTAGIVLAPFKIRSLARRYDPVRWRDDPLLARAIAFPAELAKRDLQSLDWLGLLSTVRDSMSIITPFLGELRRRYVPRSVRSFVGLRLEMALLGHGKHFPALISGVQTKTLETNRALEDLASRVRERSRPHPDLL